MLEQFFISLLTSRFQKFVNINAPSDECCLSLAGLSLNQAEAADLVNLAGMLEL